MRLIILLLVISNCFGLATEGGVTGIQSTALRESNIASKNDVGAFQLNPALAANVKRLYLDGWYTRLFNIKELPLSGGIMVFSVGKISSGIAVSHLGHSLYKETRFTFNTSRSWKTGFAAGVNMQYRQTDVLRYGSSNTIGFDGGIIYHASEVFSLAGSVQNINHPQINESGEDLEPIIRMGCAYKPSDVATVFLAVMKEGSFQPEVSKGVEFVSSDNLTLLISVELNDMTPSGVFQVRVGSIFVNYALQYHFELGATHITGISFAK